MDYEDYYSEYSEIDRLITELKDSALKGLKQDIKDKMEKLEKENKELQAVKNDWQKLEQEHKNKIRELEQKTEQSIKDAYKLPIKELMEKVQDEYYQISRESKPYKKCDKCDEQRYLHLKDDYGREHKVKCECDKSYPSKYVVKTDYMVGLGEISKDRNGKSRIFVKLSYQKPSYSYDDGYYSSSELLGEKLIENWEQFESIKNKDNSNYYNWLFKNKKDAQKYANIMNKEEI